MPLATTLPPSGSREDGGAWLTPAGRRLGVGLTLACLWVAGLLRVDGAPAMTGTNAPAFALSQWGTQGQVKLADFAGQVVVLDFFAYWCAPCKRATAEIEAQVQKHYAAARGNPSGVPVRVLGINIEPDNPKLTAQFIRQTGVELVLDDPRGQLLAQLGGAATPFIVILDGTQATAERPEFRILYRHAGFEGADTLRQIIDAVRPPGIPPTVGPAAAPPPGEKDAARVPVTRRGEATFDALAASDIQIYAGGLNYGPKHGDTEWKAAFSYSRTEEDYEPYKQFDFLGYSERVRANYYGGQATLKQRLGETLTAQVAGGAYSGFTDFRSLWLSTYYKQQYAQFFPQDYEEPNPQGFNALAGLRWEYLPVAGFAEANFLYAYDQIAPGYEMDPATGDLERGREILHTYAPTLKFENVLGARVRTLNEFQLTLTSGREPRYAYRGGVNVALGERWAWRTAGGYTSEDPELRAWYAGLTLEFELTPRWLLHVAGRYYQDTGEIENSSLLSSAAPGLQTWQVGGGLRYLGSRSSFSLSVTPVFANYDPVEVGTRPFTNLYKDRTWLSVQAAWGIDF